MVQKKSKTGKLLRSHSVVAIKCELVRMSTTSILLQLHFHALNIICMYISLFKCRCQCGNCDLQFLQNIGECYCCCELEGCVEALTSDLVLQDLPEDAKLTCITQHPGFNPVCLQKWSLRLALHKYRTKEKKKYNQTGSEER